VRVVFFFCFRCCHSGRSASPCLKKRFETGERRGTFFFPVSLRPLFPFLFPGKEAGGFGETRPLWIARRSKPQTPTPPSSFFYLIATGGELEGNKAFKCGGVLVSPKPNRELTKLMSSVFFFSEAHLSGSHFLCSQASDVDPVSPASMILEPGGTGNV